MNPTSDEYEWLFYINDEIVNLQELRSDRENTQESCTINFKSLVDSRKNTHCAAPLCQSELLLLTKKTEHNCTLKEDNYCSKNWLLCIWA